MPRAPRLALPLLLASCADPVEVALDLGPDELAVVASTVDGLLAVRIEAPGSDGLVEVESDPDRPIYTFRLRRSDFVSPTDDPLDPTTFSSLGARLEGAAPDGERGACGRCLAPARSEPQLVSPGDSCRIPVFVRGALWRPTDGGLVCSGAPDSPICAAGPEEDGRAIEEVRRAVRLDWPGPCACEPATPVSLEGIEVRPVAPEEGRFPISTFAQDGAGRIAGFSRDAALLHDPGTGATTWSELQGWPVTVSAAVASPDGAGFVVAAAELGTGFRDQFRYDRFQIEDGRLRGPEPIARGHALRAAQLRYLGTHPELNLYAIGQVVANVAGFEPALFACDDGTLACQQVTLTRCPDERELYRLLDVALLPDGTGFGLADHAFYWKEPNPPPISNPHPADEWTCAQNLDRTWPAPDGSTLKTRELRSLGRLGARLFVCAHTESEPCAPDRVVVLSATVSAGPVPNSAWLAIHQGPDASRCGEFLAVRPDLIRLSLEGGALVDFDAEGQVAATPSSAEEYGDVPDLLRVRPLPAEGSALLEATEARLFLASPGAPLERISGPDQPSGAHFRRAVAVGEGDFLLLGHPAGLVRVKILESTAEFPATSITLLADNTGAFLPADGLRDLAVDHQASEASGGPAVMIAGERSGRPLLVRLFIDDDRVARAEAIEAPGSVDVGATRIGETGLGRFLVGLQGTRLLALSNGEARELEVPFDDPDTAPLETRPSLEPDSCSGSPRRLDAWRAVGGGHGVGFAVGTHGLVFRVAAGRVDRFATPATEWSSLSVPCPDQALLAGRGLRMDLGGIERLTLQLAALEPRPETGDDSGGSPPGEQVVTTVPSELVEGVGVLEVTQGYPRAVLRDAPELEIGRGDRPLAVALASGLLVRFHGAERLDLERPPFSPEVVAQSPGGYVLYAGAEGRLALGVPRSKR